MGIAEETGTPEEHVTTPRAADEIGARITAILDAAEASAEKIRTEARAEAAQIVHQAHERAAARVEELTREPERLRDEAARESDEVRALANAYAEETRSKADVEAADLVAAAQREAQELRRDANDDVQRNEDEGRRRQDELNAQIRELSGVRDEAIEHIRAAAGGLRSAAERLETQVLPAAGGPAPEPPPARGWSKLLRRGPEASPSNDGSRVPSDDLYERAKELGIRGRSKMTRAELEEAVRNTSTANGDGS